MAAYKRRGSPHYQIAPTVDGRRMPRLSTGVSDKGLAEDMEAALRTLARMGYHSLLDQLQAGTVTLHEVWRSFIEGRESLDLLQARKDDPPLEDVIHDVEDQITDDRVLKGLDYLRQHGPAEGVRLSWLREPQNINRFYAAMKKKMAANSVRRGPHRAVADLLRITIGRGKMLGIMADVNVPAAKDERIVMLWPDEIRSTLEKADDEFRPVLALALTTGIDRAPMLGLRVRDWNDDDLILSVPDEKTDSRRRTLSLEPGMAVYVRQLAAGKESHDALVSVSRHVIRKRWEKLRDDIKRPELRWKDLRGVFATYAIWCAWPIRDLQHWMGHATLAMTARYTRRLPARTKPDPGEITDRMGLTGKHLRVRKGGLA